MQAGGTAGSGHFTAGRMCGGACLPSWGSRGAKAQSEETSKLEDCDVTLKGR